MKILAIESSGQVASIAVAEDERLLGEYTVNYKKTHSQTLLPMLDALAKMIDLDLDSLDAIAIPKGPGSFTGLRIGSATAKGLGLAKNKPLVEIPTVDGIAFNMWGTKNLVCPLMDARRNQAYTGIYKFEENGNMTALVEQCAVSVEEILDKINEYGQKVTFLGDGVPVFSSIIKQKVVVDYDFAPAHKNEQHASSLAVLAMDYVKRGEYVAARNHAPDYLRLSQAEREKIERGESILPAE